MLITQVKREKGHLFRVETQSAEVFFIDCDVWNESGIRPGDEVSDEKILGIIKQSEYARAMSRGMFFLDRADHSERALYDKIIRGGISKEAAAAAVARLKELGLMDDVRLCRRLAERMAENNISKAQSYYKLLAKGIPADIIKQTLSKIRVDETQQIREIVRKKYSDKLSCPQDVQKVCAALARKGFSYGAIRGVLREYDEQLSISDEV